MRKCTVMLFVAILALTVTSAHAVVSPIFKYQTSYEVTLNQDMPEVTNIMMLEQGAAVGASTWAFQAGGGTTTTLTNPFLFDAPIEQSLLIGIVQDLPNDAPGQKHMVLFMDDTAAGAAANIAWGTLFRNTLEDQLIANLELATSGQDWPIIQPGLDAIDTFKYGDAVDGILVPPGIPISAWFTTGGSFTVMAWSDGTAIGSGTSSVTPIPQAPVPEPASLLLLGAGLVGLGARAWRRPRK